VPPSFEKFIQRMHTLPEVVIFLRVRNVNAAVVPAVEKVEVIAYEADVYEVSVIIGFAEKAVELLGLLERYFTKKNFPNWDRDHISIFTITENIQVVNRSYWKKLPLYVYSNLKTLFPGSTGTISFIGSYITTNTFPKGTVSLESDNTVAFGLICQL